MEVQCLSHWCLITSDVHFNPMQGGVYQVSPPLKSYFSPLPDTVGPLLGVRGESLCPARTLGQRNEALPVRGMGIKEFVDLG